jgi:predicted nucleic acid-binding protein
MRIIADTNTFLAVALEEHEKEKIIALTIDQELIAPDVLPFEIGNALSALVKRKRLTEKEALSAWKATQAIQVDLRGVNVEKALAIAFENNIYAYDAYFIECATHLRCPLLTLDRRLQTIAQNHGVKILEQ